MIEVELKDAAMQRHKKKQNGGKFEQNLTGVGDHVEDAEDDQGVSAAEDVPSHANGVHHQAHLDLVVLPRDVAGQDNNFGRRRGGGGVAAL